jgi:hypothetical protein
MKVAYLAMIMIVALSMVALAVSPTAIAPVKPNVVSGVAHPTGRPGGETIEDATVIPALPFSDAGNTCDFVDDYDEVCPYTGSTSPDCVYSFAPEADVLVDIFLCMSMYDTKVYVYEDGHTPGAPYACNDDNSSCGDYNTYMYQSWLTEITFYAGHTYYIVVDGYGGDCGEYVLDVYEVLPCIVECPAGALYEGEVDCYPEYVDDFNGGLNSDPPVYSHVDCAPEIVICGTSGVFPFGDSTYRDTDWYMLTLEDDATMTIGVEAEFGALLGFVDLGSGSFYDYITTAACTYATVSRTYVGPVDVVIFVSTDSWDLGYVCGSDYYLTIDGCPVTAVEESSWGSIKALYR